MLAIIRYLSLPTGGGGIGYFFEAHLSHPRCALRMTDRGFMENVYPADACCAIWLSFRALGRF
ncbi:MAG: hypothetical protein AMJ94_10190 [Deltaproteobacteria bacterium SM23_61]|nr:MAG: hypothetical protein AMJ94_10190 [Deltaproteobacteria bacterium SM23_61]